MFRSRFRASADRLRSELAAALGEDRPPGDVAASFAVGVFVTALPSLGLGLGVLAVIGYLVDRASTLALFAAVVALNPVVKWGVYAASFSLGTLLFGPVPGATVTEPSLTAGTEIALRLVAGNLLLAVVFTAVGYASALVFARRFCRDRPDAPSEAPTTRSHAESGPADD